MRLNLKLRLRYIHHASFAKNEATLFEEVRAIVARLALMDDDCILLVSLGGKVIRFVFDLEDGMNVDRSGNVRGRTKVLKSLSYRIVGRGTFNPLMIANYAAEVGVELAGLKRLEEHLRRRYPELGAEPHAHAAA
jgi:hypothetical protein